ncbi:hypothetical protein [Fodinicola feengrottensis]|uniref:hypothetical protein n=1 Tax=Fodinicola feengrottensis TaxID=435914 RepID=UPI0013D30564|nr:hypothetical protein [Fodinicola feengrottensis]
MKLEARLVSSVERPEAYRIISHRHGVIRPNSRILVGLPESDRFQVFDLDTLLSGDQRPAADFRIPATAVGDHAFTPDLRTAVFCTADKVVATGESSWEWPLAVAGSKNGSVFVPSDGKHVWAVVPAAGDGQEWVVLDAADGKLVGRASLPWRAYSTQQQSIDGRVSVTLIEQDSCDLLGRVRARRAAAHRGLLRRGGPRRCRSEWAVADDHQPAGLVRRAADHAGRQLGGRLVRQP